MSDPIDTDGAAVDAEMGEGEEADTTDSHADEEQPQSVSTPSSLLAAQHPYTYESCAIQLVAKLLPDSGDERGRAIVVGVKNDDDVPIIEMLHVPDPTLDDLLPYLRELLQRLLDDLPRRWHVAQERKQTAQPQSLPRKSKEAKNRKGQATTATVVHPATPRQPLPPAEPFETTGATQQTLFDL